jgi:hypothetical protein
MPHSEKKKRLLEKQRGIGLLYPEFRVEIINLIIAMKQQRMPFILYETYRTPQRQRKMIELGFSKEEDAIMNPHVNGLAVDFLIDRRVVRGEKDKIANLVKSNINEKEEKKEEAIYSLGVNMMTEGKSKPRTIIEDKAVYNFWMALGTLIERQFPNLMWGGNFEKKKGQIIGADPPHIEYRHADKLIRQRKTLHVLKAQGNPGLDGVCL